MIRRIRRSWRLVGFWIAGALCIMFGSMIAGRLEKVLGVTDLNLFFGYLISFIIFLLGGLFWITVALAAKKIADEEA